MSHIKNAPTQLATPCTLQALRQWLATVDVVSTGDENEATVTSTSSHIVVA